MTYTPVGPWVDQTEPGVAPDGPAITAANLDHMEAGIVSAHQAAESASGLNPRGEWSPSVQYGPGDTVNYDGSTYIAQYPSLGDAPPSGAWQRLEVAAGHWVEDDDPRLSDARPPTEHSHPITQVVGLQSALDGKQPAGDYLTSDDVSMPSLSGAADGDGLVVSDGAFILAGTWAVVSQTAPGAPVPTRPDVPPGRVLWELWDQPGTPGAPSGMDPNDKVLDLSGSWTPA